MLLELLVVAVILAVIAIGTVLIKLVATYSSLAEKIFFITVLHGLSYLNLLLYLGVMIQVRKLEKRSTFWPKFVLVTLTTLLVVSVIGCAVYL